MRTLFHAPMKAPDHPDPSGDRAMARLLVSALGRAGCAVEIASRLRMYDGAGDTAFMQRLGAQARAEAQSLVASVKSRPAEERPDVFFTYHVHYKAPDVIGPVVSKALGIPYVVAEGSRAPKREKGPWAEGHRLAEEALDAASCILVMNERDREVLARLAPPGQRLDSFPPFVDPECWPDLRSDRIDPGTPSRLLTVAMMREGDKLASYRLLAEALGQAADQPWTLDVVGDGPAAATVRALFAPFGERVTFHGLVADRNVLARSYAGTDLLVWPAVNEAYGMVFLEAALQGCPSLAGSFGGVPGVVIDGRTGRLVAGGDAKAFAAALRDTLGDPAGLRELGSAAARFARLERTVDQAARRLGALLDDLVPSHRSAAE